MRVDPSPVNHRSAIISSYTIMYHQYHQSSIISSSHWSHITIISVYQHPSSLILRHVSSNIINMPLENRESLNPFFGPGWDRKKSKAVSVTWSWGVIMFLIRLSFLIIVSHSHHHFPGYLPVSLSHHHYPIIVTSHTLYIISSVLHASHILCIVSRVSFIMYQRSRV